ncbi:unnamed protein product, partial [Ectocarpus sp. 12 AP-2014]
PLCDPEPVRTLSVVHAHPGPHSVVELADDGGHRGNAGPGQHLTERLSIHRIKAFLGRRSTCRAVFSFSAPATVLSRGFLGATPQTVIADPSDAYQSTIRSTLHAVADLLPYVVFLLAPRHFRNCSSL